MKPLVLALLALAVASGHAGPRTIVAFGDSLTAGYGVSRSDSYPVQLQKRLRAEKPEWRVVNRGRNGETSAGALYRVGDIVRLHPDIVILETGINDLLRGYDPAETRKNVRKIVELLQKGGAKVILAGMQVEMQTHIDAGGTFRAIYPAVAKETGAKLIPSFLDSVAGLPQFTSGDGVHPNAEGYRRIVERIYPDVLATVREVEEKR